MNIKYVWWLASQPHAKVQIKINKIRFMFGSFNIQNLSWKLGLGGATFGG